MTEVMQQAAYGLQSVKDAHSVDKIRVALAFENKLDGPVVLLMDLHCCDCDNEFIGAISLDGATALHTQLAELLALAASYTHKH